MDKPIKIIFTGSQHERIDGTTPAAAPTTIEEYAELAQKSRDELISLGLCIWKESPEHIHWLLPGEWYSSLPDGLELQPISGNMKVVGVDYIDDDIRFGCLAYGFIQEI